MAKQTSVLYVTEVSRSSSASSSALGKERPSPSLELLESLGLRVVEDGFVKWREDSGFHPRNWSTSRKAFDISLVLLLDLFT